MSADATTSWRRSRTWPISSGSERENWSVSGGGERIAVPSRIRSDDGGGGSATSETWRTGSRGGNASGGRTMTPIRRAPALVAFGVMVAALGVAPGGDAQTVRFTGWGGGMQEAQ